MRGGAANDRSPREPEVTAALSSGLKVADAAREGSKASRNL
jgi:hypothetical protein